MVAGTSALAAATAPGASAASPVFAHGVASGDPLPDAIVLWTRITPTPDAVPGSGVGPATTVQWEIARDADFSDTVNDWLWDELPPVLYELLTYEPFAP